MKRIFCLLIAVMMIFVITACGGNKEETKAPTTPAVTTPLSTTAPAETTSAPVATTEATTTEATTTEATTTAATTTEAPVTPPAPTYDPAFIDIDFTSDGNVIDRSGKMSFVFYGSPAVVSLTGTAGGKSVSGNGLKVSAKGQAAIGTIPSIKTAAESSGYFNKSFAVEAFYLSAEKNSTDKGTNQGVFCGTDAGGWGLAEKNGTPYFVINLSTKYYYVYAENPTSTTEYTHVLAVYDKAVGEIRIYVNGEYIAAESVSGDYSAPTTAYFNKFVLGADIKKDGTADDFPMTKFEILDAKIYDYVPLDNQVTAMYNAAVDSFSK